MPPLLMTLVHEKAVQNVGYVLFYVTLMVLGIGSWLLKLKELLITLRLLVIDFGLFRMNVFKSLIQFVTVRYHSEFH